MAFKFVPILALLAVAHGYPGIYQAPALLKSPAALIQPAPLIAQAQLAPALLAKPAAPLLLKKEFETIDPNPQYSFAYDIKDALTGDIKNQQETLDNGVIKGQYSLIEPDGRQRIVDYIADPINGFNADVKYAGAAIAPAQPALIKTYATPAIAKATLTPALAAAAYIKTAPAYASAAYIKTAPALAPALAPAYAPALAPAYAPALAPAYAPATYIKTAPALAPAYAPLAPAAYATTLPYASTQYIKY
ncbi:cuticle protein 21-like [Phlebotomus argentipes]|uniref:cuticle protein 21-like n=1 Tax=Phlebotomus argentipes TaxID=94469 RepID=UPI002892B76C|nr:cuticle protein 21-like [Phlebotomus argentipes]